MQSSAAAHFIPWVVNASVAIVLAVGLARLGWLFLSTLSRPIPPTVERPRWGKLGRLGPAAMLLAGSLLLGLCALFNAWAHEFAPSFFNIVPLIIVWLLGVSGTFLLLIAVVSQGLLVDAHHGRTEDGDRARSLRRNFDAALLAGLGLAVLGITHFKWVREVHIAHLSIGEVAQWQSIIRAFGYWNIITALVRINWTRKDGNEAAFGAPGGWLSCVPWLLLFFAFDSTIKNLLPELYREDGRFLVDRGSNELIRQIFLDTVQQASLLAIIGAAFAAAIGFALVLGWVWPAPGRWSAKWSALPAQLAFLVSATTLAGLYLGQASTPGRITPGLWGDFTMPLLLGTLATPLLCPFWTVVRRWFRIATRPSRRRLLAEIAIWIAPMTAVAAFLYGVSLLSALQFAILLLGVATATASGLSIPGGAKKELRTAARSA
ncbi:MAG TPA: hypothetical protein VGJ75_10180 [Dongiaceae bacterium]|jgi:hypothetical protein